MVMNLSKIESEIASLRKVNTLSTADALSRVHEIVKMMGKDIEEQIENENFEALMKLYEQAAEVYLLAAEKVPREKWGVLASPSNFWEMRAEQTRLKLNLEKSLASRHRIAPISKPLRFVGSSTITPSLKSEIDNSKQIHEMGLQYPKRRRRLKVENKEELTLKSFNAEIIAAIVAKTSLNADMIKNWDIEKIEKKLGIRAQAPKMYFAGEEGEKLGLPLSPHKFMPKEVIEKRECRMDALLRNK